GVLARSEAGRRGRRRRRAERFERGRLGRAPRADAPYRGGAFESANGPGRFELAAPDGSSVVREEVLDVAAELQLRRGRGACTQGTSPCSGRGRGRNVLAAENGGHVANVRIQVARQ